MQRNKPINAHINRSSVKVNFSLRLFFYLLLVYTITVSLFYGYFSNRFEHYLINSVNNMGMKQAKIIAGFDSVINAITLRDKKALHDIAQRLSASTDFDYIIFADEHAIRLYHPNPNKIGLPMQWNRPGAIEKGESYIISGEGSIGLAVRAKTPVFNKEGTIVGIISIGYLVSTIKDWQLTFLLPIIIFTLIVVILFAIFSLFFAKYIKRQMMDLEPDEITFIVKQQEAMLGSIFEGLIAIDPHGIITAINNNGAKMLALPQEATYWLGKSINLLLAPISNYQDAFMHSTRDSVSSLNGHDVIVNSATIIIDNKNHGTIISFRLKDEIYTLSSQLSQISQYVDSLRTMRHEHINFIATIYGLLQMQEYDRAIALIQGESHTQQQLLDQLRSHIHDPIITSIIFAKAHRAHELGLTLTLMEGSYFNQLPAQLSSNDLITIIGNLLDNAFDASLRNVTGSQQIEFGIYDHPATLIIEVADQGCGIADDIYNHIFLRGVTTKVDAHNHGIGLYLIDQLVKKANGTITIEDNSPCGIIISIFIPT